MKNKFRILFTVVCFFVSLTLLAQERDTLIDSRSELVFPLFDSSSSSLEKWRTSRDFGYMDYLDSMLRKANLKVDTVRLNKETGQVSRSREKTDSSFLARIFNFRGANGFFWVLAIFFIGFIIYKVFIQSGFFSTQKRRNNIFSDPEHGEELKETDAYDRFISEAEQKQQFNLATRYWYLKTLKNLKDTKLIQYSPDKTNQEYIIELKETLFLDSFRGLTRNYEYVWYGEFFLPEDRYRKMRISFEAFNEEVINRH